MKGSTVAGGAVVHICTVYFAPLSLRETADILARGADNWLNGRCNITDPGDSLTDNLRDPDVTRDNFKRLLKMFLLSTYQ